MARNLRLSPCSFAQLVLLISKSLRETVFFDFSTLLALTLNYSNLNPFLRWPLSCGRESILRYKISRKSEQRWVSIAKESVKVLKYTAIADRKTWMVCNFFFFRSTFSRPTYDLLLCGRSFKLWNLRIFSRFYSHVYPINTYKHETRNSLSRLISRFFLEKDTE